MNLTSMKHRGGDFRLAVLVVSVAMVCCAGAAHAAQFEIVVLPDCENYIDVDTGFPGIMEAQTQWIVDHRQAENIVFVSQLGDLIHHDPDAEMPEALRTIGKLDQQVPYSVSAGNHELESTTSRQLFGDNFGPTRFAEYDWYGGSYNTFNQYQVFSAEAYDFLHISLQKDPSAATLTWAQGVIDANRGKPTILSTHDYLTTDTTRSATGNAVWNGLVKNNPQIFMTLSGHVHVAAHMLSDNSAGKPVLQILADYEDYVTAPSGNTDTGYLSKVIFDTDANTISVQTYSPTYEAVPWLTDADHQYSFRAEFLPQVDGVTSSPINILIGEPFFGDVSPPMFTGFEEAAAGATSFTRGAGGVELQWESKTTDTTGIASAADGFTDPDDPANLRQFHWNAMGVDSTITSERIDLRGLDASDLDRLKVAIDVRTYLDSGNFETSDTFDVSIWTTGKQDGVHLTETPWFRLQGNEGTGELDRINAGRDGAFTTYTTQISSLPSFPGDVGAMEIVVTGRADSANEHVLVDNLRVWIPAEVRDRCVFYNDSAFDGGDSALDASDAAAVAFGKNALLPAQTATFDNYTSFDGGINGLLIDVDHLLNADDLDRNNVGRYFRFHVGNDDDPGNWDDAPAVQDVLVRPGEGVDGSDRVMITWEDRDIANEWLQVTVLANGWTGLDDENVFYFGNSVAEAGNSGQNALVTVADLLLARNNPHNFLNPAGVDDPYDYNRDGRVDATDVLLARNNQTNFLDGLALISAPGPAAAARITPVPEPSTFVLLGTGALGLVAWAWRRRRTPGIFPGS